MASRLIQIGAVIALSLLAFEHRETILQKLKELIEWAKVKFSNEGVRVPSTEDIQFDADDEVHAFLCPISHEIMKDPVMTPYGQCFERKEIEK